MSPKPFTVSTGKFSGPFSGNVVFHPNYCISFNNSTWYVGLWTCWNADMCNVCTQQFPVNVGLKQGYVLAPLILDLFLAAAIIPSNKSLKAQDGMQIQFYLDGNLFNIRHLQCKKLLSAKSRKCSMQMTALLAHSTTSMQQALDVVSSVYDLLSLWINIQNPKLPSKKVLHSPPHPNSPVKVPHKIAQHFPYLGSILTSNCSIDDGIQVCIN